MNIASILNYLYQNSKSLIDWEVERSHGSTRIKKWNLPSPQPTEEELAEVESSAEYLAWLTAKRSVRIDGKTDAAIISLLHPSAGRGEEAGITRNALVFLFNALGIEPPEDFAAYNAIAIAEIEKAHIEKDAL